MASRIFRGHPSLASISEISGSADIALGATLAGATGVLAGDAALQLDANLWTDGPKVVIPAKTQVIEYTGVYRRPQYRTGVQFAYWQSNLVEETPSGAIEGASALVFGETATLTGAGELAASAALVFGHAAALTGSGALAASTPLAFGTGTVTLTGTGALAGAAALVFGASLSLDAGATSGSSALTFGDTATLTGAGALAGASPLVLGASGTVAGSGALVGSAALLLGTSADLGTIAGPVSGTASLVFDATGALVSLTPADAQPFVGGYFAEARRQRRKKRRDDDESKTPADTSPSAAQAGPGLSDATPGAPAADLELVRQLVAYWTGEADRNLLNRRAQRALDYALRAQTVLAMQLFERELARQMEDDDIAALLMILADD